MKKIIAWGMTLALTAGLMIAPDMTIQVQGASVSEAAQEILQETMEMEQHMEMEGEEDASGEEFVFITEESVKEDALRSKTEKNSWEDSGKVFGDEEAFQGDIFQEDAENLKTDPFSAGELSDGDINIVPREAEPDFTSGNEGEEEALGDGSSEKDHEAFYSGDDTGETEDESDIFKDKVFIGENDHELILNVENGDDITPRLNSVLLLLESRATDAAPYKVIIPPGNYELTGTICMYSNIHLYAVGATIQKTSVNKHIILRFGNTPESAPGYDGFRNITIEGGTWDLNCDCVENKEENGGFVGFRMGHATNVTVKNAVFLNNLKSHFLEFAGVKGAEITGCTFRGYWKPYEGGGQECIQLDACQDGIFPGYLPFDGAICEDVLIDGNTFQDVFSGVGSHSMMFDKPYKNITITNNTFTNVKKRAVWCMNYVDSRVSGNEMKNVGGGVHVRSVYSKNTHLIDGENANNSQNQQPENVIVTNNSITVSKPSVMNGVFWRSFGIRVEGENTTENSKGVPSGKYIIKGITVKNNQISGFGSGIRLDLADKCTVSSNKVQLQNPGSFKNFGIYLGASSQNTIAGNVVEKARNHGIYVYNGSASYKRSSSKNVISKNTISGCYENGLFIEAGSNSSTIQRNTCLKNKGHGIAIYNSSILSLASNRTDSNSKYGIYAYKCTIKDQGRNSMSNNAGNYMMRMSGCKGKVQSMRKFSVSQVNYKSKKIGGTALGASVVSVKLKKNNKKLAVSKVSSKGKYILNIKPQKKGTVFVLTVQDKYKNVSVKEDKVR